MVDIATFFSGDERIHVWHSGECDEQGKCVLYWMQRAQRGQENMALNAAIALANTLRLPVVVLFVLTEYPAANLRHYTFLLEGLTVAAYYLKERGTPLVIRHGEPEEEVVKMARELHAAAVISDMSELRVPRRWRKEVSEHVGVPFACVDDGVVPMRLLPKEEWAARTIRPKIERLLPAYMQPVVDLKPDYPLYELPHGAGETLQPMDYLDRLKIDLSVQPSPTFRGGQDEGRQRLRRFIEERLGHYAELRNHPEVGGTSELSAYLHFGHLSVVQLAWEIERYTPPASGSSHIDVDGGRAAFLEELRIRGPLAINFAYHNPYYDSLEGCPEWGKETLRKHAKDPREYLYTRDELEQSRTHDELWNACQREMVQTGRMHGYMRMYWGKKILEWSETPQEAFAATVYLNDKYELDGRDSNGYAGIAWALGGKHDRPWAPERPIFGLVRYMALSGMKRKFDTRLYIRQWSENPLFR